MKKSIINRLKANKLFRKSVSMITFAGVAVAPSFALAAASPVSKYRAVIDGITNMILTLTIPAAILACVVYGLMYKFAGSNQHRKAEIIDSIKGTAGILIFVLTAGVLMKWIAGFLG